MSTAAASRTPEHHTYDGCGCEEHRILYRFSVREIHLNIVRCAGCDVVLIAVPNFQSWERKIFQKNWAWLDVPFHLHHFEPARLLKLVAAAGLKTLDLRFTSAGPSFEHSLEKTCFQSTYAALRRLKVAPPF